VTMPIVLAMDGGHKGHTFVGTPPTCLIFWRIRASGPITFFTSVTSCRYSQVSGKVT
jgi:hypothetical protein